MTKTLNQIFFFLHQNLVSTIHGNFDMSDVQKNKYNFRRERPFNLKGWGGYGFFLKKYSDSQCC
jgi:hypothetical protein